MSLYLILLIASISAPLLLSFDKKVHFYTQWKYVFPAILVTATIFIVFDVIFAEEGVWGFNKDYYGSIELWNLPLEEVLFFIIVPYACLFLHDCFQSYFPRSKVNTKALIYITIALLILFVIVASIHIHHRYTFYIAIKSIIVLMTAFFISRQSLSVFLISFIIMLIPFAIVNGILTGSFFDSEIVWYNEKEFMGYRFLTIPLEDFAYAFSLILMNLVITERLKKLY